MIIYNNNTYIPVKHVTTFFKQISGNSLNILTNLKLHCEYAHEYSFWFNENRLINRIFEIGSKQKLVQNIWVFIRNFVFLR